MTVCERCGRELVAVRDEHAPVGWVPWRHADIDEWARDPHEAVPAPTLPIGAPERAQCPVCGHSIRVEDDGTLAEHGTKRMMIDDPVRCAGSGRVPS